MTSLWIATLGASALCYFLKLLGYTIPENWLARPRIQRINLLIPVVLLSALVAVQTFKSDQSITVDHRIVGLLVAVVALKMRRSFPVMMISAAISSALVYNFIN